MAVVNLLFLLQHGAQHYVRVMPMPANSSGGILLPVGEGKHGNPSHIRLLPLPSTVGRGGWLLPGRAASEAAAAAPEASSSKKRVRGSKVCVCVACIVVFVHGLGSKCCCLTRGVMLWVCFAQTPAVASPVEAAAPAGM